MKLPEIRIKDGWLLRDNASRHLNEFWGEGQPLRPDDEYLDIVLRYQKAWRPHEQAILTYMCNQLSLEFRQNIIDVYIAPWFFAFSDPMVIGVTFTDEEFIDNLTHELLHRLLTDNTSVAHSYDISINWKKLFGEQHDFNTLVHIPVHAVHKAIYEDLLNVPNRYDDELKMLKENKATAYLDSWSYVDKHDYHEIIRQLEELYDSLKSQNTNT